MAKYWASCSSGLEFALIAELQNLDGTCILSDSLILGGVLFSTLSTPTEILQLRSADNVYAFVGKFQAVPFEKDLAVPYLKEITKKVDWEPPLDLFMQWKSHGFGSILQTHTPLDLTRSLEGNNIEYQSISFRVSCNRACVKMKKHGFTSMEAAAALGEGVQKRFGWPADMCSYDLEIVAWIRDDEIFLALALLYSGKIAISKMMAQGQTIEASVQFPNKEKPPQKKKSSRPSRADSQLYSWRPYRKVLVGTSLKPSIAYALLQLGHILPGNIVVDPMCGCGTIPLEAVDWLRSRVICLAGDIGSKAVDASSENINASGVLGRCDLLRWNAANLPLRKGIVDRIVCDMPFGVRCGTCRSREWLCPKVVKEVTRVLQLGTGIAVLLSQSKAARHEIEIKQRSFLELRKHIPIEIEGLRVEIIVVQRTMEPYDEE